MISRSGKSGPSLAVGFLLVALISVVFSILQAGSPITGWDWRTGFGMPVCFFSLVVLYLHGVLGANLTLARSMMERDLKDRRLEQVRKATSCLWWEIDREGVVAETTEGDPTIPGFNPKAMIGKSLLDFILQEDREMVKSFLDEHVLKRNPFQGLEHRLLTRDGHEQWVRVSGIPCFDDQDSITGFQITAVPIDELKETKLELQHKEFELRSLIDILPGLFYRCLPGPDGAFIFINPEIESLTGYSMTEFLDDGRRSFRALIHPDDAHRVQFALLKAIEEHRYYEIRYHLCRADGEIRQILERGRAFYDRNGEALHLDGAVIDVTGELETHWGARRSASA
jgi:PAS domain S-box-containing protein